MSAPGLLPVFLLQTECGQYSQGGRAENCQIAQRNRDFGNIIALLLLLLIDHAKD
jgi:hypothetical protein